jgi:hypothetical protein
MRYLAIAGACLPMLAGGGRHAQQSALIAGAETLASIAAANNSTVGTLVSKGALFCKKEGPTISVVFAVTTVAGGPLASVLNQSSNAVAQTCQALQAIPVSAPDNAASVPVVTAAPIAAPALPPVS